MQPHGCCQKAGGVEGPAGMDSDLNTLSCRHRGGKGGGRGGVVGVGGDCGHLGI